MKRFAEGCGRGAVCRRCGREQGAHGDGAASAAQMDVHVEAMKVTAWRSASVAMGAGRPVARRAAEPACGGGLAVLVSGTGKDDFAFGLLRLRIALAARCWGGKGAPQKTAAKRAGRKWRSKRGQATENFMSPGLSNFFGFDGGAGGGAGAPSLPAVVRRWRKAS